MFDAIERQQLTIQRSEEVNHVAVQVRCMSSTEGNKGLEEAIGMFGVFKGTTWKQMCLK